LYNNKENKGKKKRILIVVSRIGTISASTQRLSHALGGPAAPLWHMTAVSTVTTSLAKSFVHGLSGNTSPSPQGAKGMGAMEIDDNYLGHLSYGLELDDIENDLPNSTIVPNDHNLVSEGSRMQKDLPYI